MSKISELSDGGVIQGGDTLIAVRSGGNVKVTYGGSTTANIDGGTIDGTVIGGTTPAAITGTTITGTSFVSSGDMTFGDNDKAVFGAGSDLQIYHTGSHSTIEDIGTGNLQIHATDFRLRNSAGTESMILANAGGNVQLYYDNSLKLSTTATGIDVTGTVTADGLTVDGDVVFNDNGADVDFRVESDTNTHALFVQGSSGNVGINTSSPVKLLELSGNNSGDTSDNPVATLRLSDLDGSTASEQPIGKIEFYGNDPTVPSQNVMAYILSKAASTSGGGDLRFGVCPSGVSSEKMRIDSSGNVGIGTSSPSNVLHINNSNPTIRLEDSDGSGAGIAQVQNTASGNLRLIADPNNDGAASSTIEFEVDGSEAMRIDASGNLLVGTTGIPNGTSIYGAAFEASSGDRMELNFGASSASDLYAIRFFNPNGEVGSIRTSGSTTSYNTSSDQRLKDNIVDAPSSSDDIDAIQVRSFDWKADGFHQKYGMIAQELMTVAPEAVSGDPESDEMMGVDYSKLVPMLVKEIQSLRARVAQLETN